MFSEALAARHEMLRLPGGGAETVLPLHGIGMTTDLNWGGSFAMLRQRFLVLAPDLRGHGRSGSPSHSFRLEACADDVVALAEALGIKTFHRCRLFDGRFGGAAAVAQTPRTDQPAGVVRELPQVPRHTGRAKVSLFAPAVTAAARMNPLLFSLGAGMRGPSLVKGLDGAQRQLALTEMNRTSVTTVTAALVAVSKFTSHDRIGQIDVPVSVLVTTLDTVVPPARQRRLAEAIPHATVRTVEGDTRCASTTRTASARSYSKRASALTDSPRTV